MKIDIDIGWDDLSRECKEKIKMLHRVSKGTDVKITYPTAEKMFRYYDQNGIANSDHGISISNGESTISSYVTTRDTRLNNTYNSLNTTEASPDDTRIN